MAWRINATPTAAEKAYRKFITKYYGYQTVLFALAFLTCFSILNYVIPRLPKLWFYITPRRNDHFVQNKHHPHHTHESSPEPHQRPYTDGSDLSSDDEGTTFSSSTSQPDIPSNHIPPSSQSFNWPLSLFTIPCIISIIYFCFADTHQDLVFLAKRFGRVAIALLPPSYFLTLRPTPLPNSFYLQLLPFHKWISRFSVILVLLHTILYLFIYIKIHKLQKLTTWPNICGIIACIIFLTMGLSSLKSVRRKFYCVFYFIHYLLAWICLPLIAYHSTPPSPAYVISCVSILIVQLVYRVTHTTHLRLPVQYITPTMYLINIPKSRLPSGLKLGQFSPGSHLRLSNPLWNPLSWLQSSHPYTIASLPHDPYIAVVIRKTRYPIKMRNIYGVLGPFASLPRFVTNDIAQQSVRRVLLVVGGTGIAFAAPVMRYLKAMNIPVKLLWAIRDINDIKVLEPLGLHEMVLSYSEIEIYVTGYGNSFADSYGSTDTFTETNMNSRLFDHEAQESSAKLADRDEDLDVDIDDSCCGADGSGRPLLLKESRSFKSLRSKQTSLSQLIAENRPSSIRSMISSSSLNSFAEDDLVQEYSPVIYNSRPVLNLGIKTWLCGLQADGNDCCCVDKLLDVKSADRQGCWIMASGAEALVNETHRWASRNGFSFFKDEFSL